MNSFEFAVDEGIQQHLEELAATIVVDRSIKTGNRFLDRNSIGYEDVQADRTASAYILDRTLGYNPDATVLMEGALREGSDQVHVWDPIDGSSGFGALGPRRSVLMTAGMVYEDNNVLGAVVGDVWNESLFVMRENGIYRKSAADNFSSTKKVNLEPRKVDVPLEKTKVTTYFNSRDRMRLVAPLFDAVGQVFSPRSHLSIVDGDVHVALEMLPVPLYEHIFQTMLASEGCYLARLDGSPLKLDYRKEQTSVVATSRAVGEQIVEKLAPTLKEHVRGLRVSKLV